MSKREGYVSCLCRRMRRIIESQVHLDRIAHVTITMLDLNQANVSNGFFLRRYGAETLLSLSAGYCCWF